MDEPKPAFMEEYLHQAALSGDAGHDEKLILQSQVYGPQHTVKFWGKGWSDPGYTLHWQTATPTGDSGSGPGWNPAKNIENLMLTGSV